MKQIRNFAVCGFLFFSILLLAGCATSENSTANPYEDVLERLGLETILPSYDEEGGLILPNGRDDRSVIVLPEWTPTEKEWETLDLFVEHGGGLLVIANPSVAERYGLSVETMTSDNLPLLGTAPFDRKETWEAFDVSSFDLPCPSFADFSQTSASLVFHAYCPTGTGDGELSNLAFVSTTLLDLLSEDTTLSEIQLRVQSALGDPEPFPLSNNPSFNVSPIKINPKASRELWIFELAQDPFYGILTVLLVAFLLLFSFAPRLTGQPSARWVSAPGKWVVQGLGISCALWGLVLLAMSQRSEIDWIELFKTHLALGLTAVNLLLVLALMAVFKAYPRHVVLIRTLFFSPFRRAIPPNSFPAHSLYAGFFLVSFFSVYNLFFFHWFPMAWVLMAAGLGLLTCGVLGDLAASAPTSYSKHALFVVSVFAWALLPLSLVYSLVDLKLPFLSTQENLTSFTLTAPDWTNSSVFLKRPQGQASTAWVLPGGELLLSSPFGVELHELPSSNPIQMTAEFQGYGGWTWEHEDSSNLLFLSALASFEPLYRFELEGVSLYGNLEADPIYLTSDLWRWKNFILKNLPLESTVTFLSSTGQIAPLTTPLVTLPWVDSTSSTFETNLLWGGNFQFYTPLPSESSTLEVGFTFSPLTFPPETETLSGAFVVEDRLGDVVYEQPFNLESVTPQKPFDLRFEVPDLEPETYRFYLQFLFVGETELRLDSITVNSPYLTLSSDALNNLGENTVYFKHVQDAPLSFKPEDDASLETGDEWYAKKVDEDALLLLSELIVDYDSLYAFTFPSGLGELSSVGSVFYSFSEGSWFYPYPFYASLDIEAVDYFLVEHALPLAEYEAGDWTWDQVYEFELLPDGSDYELWFDLPPSATSNPSWILLKTLTFTPSP